MGFAGVGPIGPSLYPNNVSINRSLEAVRKFAAGSSTANVMGDKMGEGDGSYYESSFEKQPKKKQEESFGQKFVADA